MTTLYEGAFAKINLTLDVLGKRADGYHDLQSVMQTISIRDDVEIDVGTGKPWRLLCSVEGIPTDEKNLAWRRRRSTATPWTRPGGAGDPHRQAHSRRGGLRRRQRRRRPRCCGR